MMSQHKTGKRTVKCGVRRVCSLLRISPKLPPYFGVCQGVLAERGMGRTNGLVGKSRPSGGFPSLQPLWSDATALRQVPRRFSIVMFLYRDDQFLKHETGAHPESSARLEAVHAALSGSGFPERSVLKKGRPAEHLVLGRVHSGAHIVRVQQLRSEEHTSELQSH